MHLVVKVIGVWCARTLHPVAGAMPEDEQFYSHHGTGGDKDGFHPTMGPVLISVVRLDKSMVLYSDGDGGRKTESLSFVLGDTWNLSQSMMRYG